CEGDAFEGVVVVVQDDHVPRPPEARPFAAVDALSGRSKRAHAGRVVSDSMSAVALDVAAVRARFSALANETAFFDGPGGTQVPDSVIDAIADYLRHSNANLDGPFGNSRRTNALVTLARLAAAAFLRC